MIAGEHTVSVIESQRGAVLRQTRSPSGLREDTRSTPTRRVRIDGARLARENTWPTTDGVGLQVVLPGSEVGILIDWSHADGGERMDLARGVPQPLMNGPVPRVEGRAIEVEGEVMRRLVVIEFLSLDGVMQAPGDPQEDTEGGFRHGGWQRQYFDDVLGAEAARGMAVTDAQLFGRKTYEKMAAYWPTAPSDDPFAQHLNGVREYVASRTLQHVEWQNTTLLQGDVAEAVAELKRQPGGSIGVLGSGDLVQTLIQHDLVDEYSLTVSPIVLGGGKRLFRGRDEVMKLRLVDSTTTTTGSVILTYEPTR